MKPLFSVKILVLKEHSVIMRLNRLKNSKIMKGENS